MTEGKYYFFDEDSCDLCGVCLSKCPVMGLPVEEAKEEVRRLVEGEEARHVFSKCTGCMTCNLLCPKDCKPYDLILYRLYERYRRDGLPSIARFMVTPTQTPSNVWSLALSEDERETFRLWEEAAEAAERRGVEEVVYPGCVMCFPPYLSHSKLFDSLTIAMRNELCCGEPFYRIGVLDVAEQAARRLEEWFRRIGARKVVFPCLGCYNTIMKIYPERFGVKYDFEGVAFLDLIWDKIESGEVKVKNRLNIKVTVHDNCHSKPFGDKYHDLTRMILEKLGAEIVEMKHNRENASCCGLAAFAIRQDPADVVNVATGVIEEAEETGAEALVVRCGGCLTTLSVASTLSLGRMPVYHIIELVQKAIGEEPQRGSVERSGRIVKLLFEELPKQFANLPERYWVTLQDREER